MKLRNVLLTVAFITISFFSYGQKQGNIWYFGKYAGLDFNSGNPVVLTNGKMYTSEGCATISDKNTGQLLFYTNGDSIWDKTHGLMPNGTALLGNQTSTQSGVIVPMPGSSTKYYVFTIGPQAGFSSFPPPPYGGMAYSVVDMTLNGGKGDVSVLNQKLVNLASEKLCAVKHCNGKDIWVLAHEWNSDAFYAYLLTASGVQAPIVTHIGVVHQDVGSGQNGESIGYMKFSPDGKKIALACNIDLNTVQIFDFDNSSGTLSNVITDTDFINATFADGPYGVSFSPDNSKLYVSYYGFRFTLIGYDAPSYIYQYNMQAGNGAAIIASRTIVSTQYGIALAGMQIGPDGKIYIAKESSDYNDLADVELDYLDVIDNPNALGAACNYRVDEIYLNVNGNNRSTNGLPDVVENFLVPPYTATLTYPTGCSSSGTLAFSDSTLSGNVEVSWNFGDPVSGINNTSTLQNPNHNFSANGSYTVKIILSNPCLVDSFTKTITISSTALIIDAGADVTICTGSNTQLNVTGGKVSTVYSWQPVTGLNCTTCSNPVASPTATTTYVITANDNGCTDKDTLIVNVTGQVNATAKPDTSVCRGSSVQLIATGGNSYSWAPATGLNSSTVANPVATPTATTTYTVTVSAGGTCNPVTKTVTVVITPVPAIDAGTAVTICSGGSTILNATGTGINTYLWSPVTALSCTICASPTASPTITTKYRVTANAASFCPASDTVTVSVIPASIVAAGPDTSVCIGGSAQLFASGGAAYSWSPSAGLNNSTVQSPIASPVATTTFTVSISGAGCPSSTLAVTVTVLTPVNADAGENQVIQLGTSAQLNATGGAVYIWSPAAGLDNPLISNPVSTPSLTTTYTVTTTDQDGCTGTDEIVITVVSEPFVTYPNAFTPNGDGLNDQFFGHFFKVKTVELKIYNRWGQLVFESADTKASWDGKYKGKEAPVGSYGYFAEAVTDDGVKISKQGNITLIR